MRPPFCQPQDPPSQRRTLLVDSSSCVFLYRNMHYYPITSAKHSRIQQGSHTAISEPGEQLFGGLPDRTGELAVVCALRYKFSPAQGH